MLVPQVRHSVLHVWCISKNVAGCVCWAQPAAVLWLVRHVSLKPSPLVYIHGGIIRCGLVSCLICVLSTQP